MKLIIAGGRDYTFSAEDFARLDALPITVSEVVSGAATGADAGGGSVGESSGDPREAIPGGLEDARARGWADSQRADG